MDLCKRKIVSKHLWRSAILIVAASLSACGEASGPCSGVELTMTSSTKFMVRNDSDQPKVVTVVIKDLVAGSEKRSSTVRVDAEDVVTNSVTHLPAGMVLEILECN